MSKGIINNLGLDVICVPKFLYTNAKYKNLSGDAKVVYSVMLGLLDKSDAMGWIDKDGCKYVQMTARNIKDMLDCSDAHVTTIYKSLEKAGLIIRIRKPCEIARIYICNIFR
ncbi:MAG: replication initiator protein A [Lachnospiraceae bacterium]|nr:replication initiator protein A [Lachnospiraceae bacterium]